MRTARLEPCPITSRPTGSTTSPRSTRPAWTRSRRGSTRPTRCDDGQASPSRRPQVNRGREGRHHRRLGRRRGGAASAWSGQHGAHRGRGAGSRTQVRRLGSLNAAPSPPRAISSPRPPTQLRSPGGRGQRHVLTADSAQARDEVGGCGAGGGVDYKGAWSAGTAYVQGDVVLYNGVEYIARQPRHRADAACRRDIPPLVIGMGTALPSSPFDGQEIDPR